MEDTIIQQPQAQNEAPEAAPVEQASPPVIEQTAAPEQNAQENENKGGRAQRRISDLTHELKQAKEEAERAKAQASDFFNQAPAPTDPWQAYASGDITVDELKQLVKQETTQTADFVSGAKVQQLERKLAEKEFWGNMEADVRRMEAENPKFNPSSPQFDAEYVEELSSLYTEAYGKDPQKLMQAPPLSKFVARIEKMRSRAEAQGIEQSSAQLAQQAAEGAVMSNPSAKGTQSDPAKAAREQGVQTGDFKGFFKTWIPSDH